MGLLDESQAERLLATFLDLVRIDSPSGSESACSAYCAQALAEAGCDVRFDDSAGVTGSDTGNLIAELSGTTGRTLLLSAHMDCVEPCRGVEPAVKDGVVVSAGETVLGADDKAGLAAAIECVRILSGRVGPRPAVRCVFTVKEEVGLTGAKALAREDVECDLCLVLDADGAPGGIVVAAPTHYTFSASFVGRAAHAGVSPEAGVSAVAMAAAAVARLRIGRIDEVSTANVGSITGGGATNIITAQVDITGECRSIDRNRVEEIKSEMTSVMEEEARRAGGAVKVAWSLEYEGFALSDDAPPVVLVSAACDSLGLEPVTFSTGGGSDANIIAAHGVPTLALSCGMSGVHGTDENIRVADLEALTALCVAVAAGLAEGPY